jgi:AcrR family transcriptional regulator
MTKKRIWSLVMKTAKRQPALGPQTRDLLLDAMERLLARYGYQKTTMDDVARDAGVGKGTIYLHFPSKEELVLSTIDRIVDRLLRRLEEIARLPQPADRRLREMLLIRVLFRFDSVRDYPQGVNDLLAALRPAYLARRQRYFAAEAEVLAAVLREGQAAGVFTCPDPLAAAHTLLLATNSLLPYSLSAHELGKRKDVQDRAGRIADLVLDGLRKRSSP